LSPEPGAVYRVDLGISGKARFFVVVSRRDDDPPRALALCVPITTQNRESDYEVPLPRVRFLREQSYANVQGLQATQYHDRSVASPRRPWMPSATRCGMRWSSEVAGDRGSASADAMRR
jgi:mRNA interferase MazF